MAPPPDRSPGLGTRRLPWVAAGVCSLLATGWLLASREEPVPAPADGAAPTTISARHDTRILYGAPAAGEPEPGTSPAARPDAPKILQAMKPERMVPSPRRLDDSPREPRFWEPGQDDLHAPDAPDVGVAIDDPAAAAVLEQEEWHDEEWFGDNRPLPGEGE